MFLKKIRSFIKLVFLLFLLAGSAIILANALIQSSYIQKEILKGVSNAIGYDIQAKDIEINFWKGLSISINDLAARSRQGSENFTASSVRLTLDVKELLAGRIIPSSFYLFKPLIELPWEKGYDLQTDLKGFLPKKIPAFWFPGIRSLVIDEGQVVFTGASFRLDEFYCSAGRISSSPLTLKVISRGQIGFKGEKAGFEMHGNVMPPSNDKDSLLIDIKIITDQAPLSWVHWPASIPMKDGYFTTRLDIEGDPTDHLSMKGLIDLNRLEFEILKKDKHKGFLIPEITLDFQSIIRGDNIDVHPLKIRSDDLSLDLGLIFDLKNGNDSFLDLNFKSEFMGVETFKTLFPSPLLPLWFEDRLLRILTSGDIRVNNFSLKGDIDQIRHMSRQENRSVMEMLFECRGFEISGGGIQLPFKEVSAQVALKDGLFSVSALKANFGDSMIKDAGLNIRDIFSDSPFYEILMDGDFDIKELLSQKEMEVLPVAASRLLDQWPEITGRLTCKTAIGYQHEWDYPRILNGEFLLNGFSLDKKEYIFPLKFSEASIHMDDAGSDYMSGSGSWGNNSFSMSANFGISGITPNFTDGLLSADVDMNQVLSILHSKDKIPLTFSETLYWDLALAKEGKDWSLKGRTNLGGTTMNSGGFTIKSSGSSKDNIVFELGIKPDDNRIDIKNVLLKLNDSSINMTGVYDLQARKFNEVTLNSSGLSMKDLSVISDKKEIFSNGAIKGNLNISMPDGDGHNVLITGLLEGSELSLQPGKTYPQISDCSFQLGFSGKEATLNLNYCNMKAGKNLFSISGDIKGWNELKGEMKLHSDYLDFSDGLPIEDISSINDNRDNASGLMDHLNLEIQMDVTGGIWRKLPYGPAKADLVFDNGNISIKNSKVNLHNGELNIKGHILKGPEPELLFTGDINIKGQPVDELLEGLGIDYKGLKGNLDIKGALSMNGREKKDLISNLNGSVKVLIQKGLFKNPNVIIKVLDFLSLQKIFEQRPSNLKEEGLYFESISGDAVIKKGILKSDNFVMRSPVLNAVAYGKADIPGKKFNFILGAQPHGTIDSLISKVPILGYIITGKNKSIVAYPFEVKGPFSDPDVKFVPFDTLEGGAAGILKRIFLTPVRIFNKIDKALNKNGEKSVP